MKDAIRNRLRSTFDPRQVDDKENLLALHRLSHISRTNPAFYRKILGEYGFLTHAFKDAFGFGLPLDDFFLHRTGLIDEIGYMLITKGEDAALAYAQEWTISSTRFKRIKYSINMRQERFIKQVMQGDLPDTLSTLEQAILEKRGISPENALCGRPALLEKLSHIHEQDGLTSLLNLKDTHPSLYKETLLHFGRVPKALLALGITEDYIVQHLKDTGLLDKMLLWYLDGRREELLPVKSAYHLHQRRFNFYLDRFEEKRTGLLHEGSSITGSSYEDELDSYLHNERLDEDIYVLHQHHSRYRDLVPDHIGRELCDFRIGNTFIEVAGGLDAQQFFPGYAQTLAKKKTLAEAAGIQFIILTTDDFRRGRYRHILTSLLDTAREEGIERIAPDGLFCYEAADLSQYYYSSEGQRRHFKNREAWWNQHR
ncbi:MAG: hypothetical protein ABIJ21_01710 [Nanoarchaeota archaeon]